MSGGLPRSPLLDSGTATVWTVSQLNQVVRTLVEEAFPRLCVVGELGSWKRASSGHCYFTLKDGTARLDCVMWRAHAGRLPTEPKEGMRLRAYGGLTLYEARGRYQMVVTRIEAEEGEGLWRLAIERLRRKLEEEGLLAPARKRAIPSFPATVGVVTSLGGAALHDILTVLRRRAPWTRVIVHGTRVQGEGASREIADALRFLDAHGVADVIVVGRGGGSLEDLRAFNEEPLARALADTSVPVVSAVGHEIDVTIADLVADLRAPTPSAAAEVIVPDRVVLARGLRTMRLRLAGGLRSGGRRWRGVAGQLSGRLSGGIEGILEARGERVEEGRARLLAALRRTIDERRHLLLLSAGKIETLSPLSTLRRGYAVALSRDGEVLRRVDDFRRGLDFSLRLADGRVGCEVVDSSGREGIVG